MKKKGHRPVTRVKNPEPKIEDPNWVIWAACYGEKEFMKKVSNIEKNLNTLENKCLVKLKKVIIYNL